MIDWSHTVNLIFGTRRNDKVGIESEVDFGVFGDWPTGYTAFLVKQSIHRGMKVI